MLTCKIILFLAVTLGACNNHSIQVTDEKDSEAINSKSIWDTSGASNKALGSELKFQIGVYRVRIPCSTCKDAEHTVAFFKDHRFHLEETIVRKTKQFTIIKGLWKQEGNKIILYREDQIAALYFWQGQKLFLQQSAGENLPMTLLPSADNNKVWQDKKRSGNEYFGVGNEPFWNMEINGKSEIIFRLADWTKPKTFQLGAKKLSSDSTVYTGLLNAENIRVSIFHTFCSDGMSDLIYNTRVSVLLNDTLYQGCGIYLNNL